MIGPAILFCPGDRPDRFAKAAARADAVILDLEDAVAPEDKPAARASVLDGLPSLDPVRTIVRINALDSPWGHDDARALRALAAPPLVMLPKVRASADLDALAPLAVIALCETAEGVLAAPSIARAATCAGLMWGSEDLVADLGGRPGRGPDGRYRAVLEHARSTVLLAAAAAGRPAIDTVVVDLDDLDTLRADAEYAAAAGFTAKACVHPNQVDPVRAAFAATPAEVEWATGVLRAAEGRAGVFRHRGRMIDAPVLAAARAVLARRPSR